MSLHDAPPREIARKRALKEGFTLIEMSIVLVIIGLIVGGILVGQDLIKQAEIRSMMTDIERYKTAVYTFRDKYGCLAGDCANATNFFGVSTMGCALAGNQRSASVAGGVAAAGTTGTCNGNGDGEVYSYTAYSASSGGGPLFELVLFWHHLSLARLVQGSFTGIKDATFFGLVAGVNAPSTIRNGGVYFGYADPGSITYASPTISGHMFQFGSPDINGGFSGGLLTPSEAQDIDIKYDDGKPATGNILENTWGGWAHLTCDVTNNVSTRAYNIADNSRDCSPIFVFRY